ncbi:1,2-dihydroxy-3-keto-5-methylthiopentene dioxygenase [Basidiobolus ranarum]|uniref:1,2-dihydroxy-3-keto-5-methylthiopentene dioxygenase n=1 Tax=Basidiobolus ranarum TaxID=34480 RepID=A0ABR2VW36_9FUNG
MYGHMSLMEKTKPSITPEYTLPGVLHFLQVEWRRFERDRNEWEIEKAAMKARVAFLEGERRGVENIKADLMRRVKMLEFALRKERNKYVEQNTTKKSPMEMLRDSDQEKSGPSTLPKTRSEELSGENRASLLQSYSSPSLYSHFNTANNTKSKAKTRDILRSCLQEVGYLTDISAPDPTPEPMEETLVQQEHSASEDLESQSTSQTPPVEKQVIFTRPRSQSETSIVKPIPTLLAKIRQVKKTPEPEIKGEVEDPIGAVDLNVQVALDLDTSVIEDIPYISEEPSSDNGDEHVTLRVRDPEADEKKKRRITVLAPPTYDGDLLETLEKRDDGDDHGIQTREKLTNSNSEVIDADNEEETLMREIQDQYNISSEKLTTIMQKYDSKSKTEATESLNELDSLTWSLDNNDVDSSTNEARTESKNLDERLWKPKLALRSHLDTVRAIDFHPTNPILASGSEDGLVKLWRIRKNTSKKAPECEPFMNFRGHTSAVSSVLFMTEQNKCYSSSLDSTIRIWNLPPSDRDLYSANDAAISCGAFIGHTDSIWDMRLHPEQSGGTRLIASASADGTVKLWDVENNSSPLKSSIGYDGINAGGEINGMDKYSPNPTSIEFSHSELNKLMIAYQNSIIRLFDIETGQPILNFNSDSTYDSTNATQINKIVAHPTLPLVISAHEDRYIRFFDINSGQCIHSMIAHLDSVSTLDINHTGLQLVSGGHDSSIRVWDTTMYTCLQEFSSHRRKSDEGVCCVRYHLSLPWLASGGTDSVVKIYVPPS